MKEYNNTNIFAKIIRGEIPCNKVYEDKEALCFYDINPQAKIHVLLIPKGEYVSYDDFVDKADDKTIVSFFNKINLIIKKLKLETSGFRIISNTGINANQEVPHFHIHILGSENLGGINSK